MVLFRVPKHKVTIASSGDSSSQKCRRCDKIVDDPVGDSGDKSATRTEKRRAPAAMIAAEAQCFPIQ